MKYIWEEEDIIAGRCATSDAVTRSVTIVVDPFPPMDSAHRRWRLLENDTSYLSCLYSKSEIAYYLTDRQFSPH